MEISWNNKEPIYIQLRDRLAELIMDGVLTEGDALPSVRQISSEQRINPITVSKALQILVDEDLVEKNGGLECMLSAERKTDYQSRRELNFLMKSGHKLPNELKDWAWKLTNSLAERRIDRNREVLGIGDE